MPENDGFKKTYAIYDRMSTESLNAILELEARLGGNGELDSGAIAYIAGVIARREESAQALPDLQAAWKVFERDYLSCPGIGATLYSFDGDDPEIADALCTEKGTDCKRINLCSVLENQAEPPLKKPRKRFFMLGRVVAVLAAVLLAGSITAHAFNTSLTRIVGQCFNSLFSFVMLGDAEPNSNVTRPDVPPVTYASLEDALAAYQITTQLAPTWFPDGYMPDRVTVDSISGGVNFTAFYTNQSHEEIVITVSEISESKELRTYEEDSKKVSVFKFNDIEHYFMGNNDDLRAAWIHDSYECKISGNISGAELQKMVESIYKG